MESATRAKFVHRANRDDTFDSVCRKCFATVGTADSENELEKSEQVHVCDPWRVEKYHEVSRGE